MVSGHISVERISNYGHQPGRYCGSAALSNLEEIASDTHPLPRPVVAVSYDEETVLLSDGEPYELADRCPNFGTRGRSRGWSPGRTATWSLPTPTWASSTPNRAIRETTGYMLDTLGYGRTLGAPGDNDLDVSARLPRR